MIPLAQLTPLVQWALALAALTGHAVIWMALFNRLNALSSIAADALEKLVLAALVAPAAWGAWQLVLAERPLLWQLPTWLAGYGLFCIGALLCKAPRWIRQRVSASRRPACLLEHSARRLPPVQLPQAAAGVGSVAAWIPGNQASLLQCERKSLLLDRLPARMSGLTITHLSDFHFTGRLSAAYFQWVVDQANQLESDLIVITGDLVDSPRCLSWIEPLLGRLQAPDGVYYVLGNHDRRPGADLVRGELERAGLIGLGGRSLLLEAAAGRVLLAGDERPWFGDEPQIQQWSRADLRVLLAHTPDRYQWARRQGFDLMLAGHTHGGQICLPWLGPVATPSRHGTRYAGGVFQEPPTLMHVSRGISSELPVRFACPPELTQLVLTSPSEVDQIQKTEVRVPVGREVESGAWDRYQARHLL